MKKIVLLGFVYNDPKQEQRLLRAFDRYKPDIITREWSKDRDGMADCSAAIRTAARYARQKGIPVHDVDPMWVDRILDGIATMHKMMREDTLLRNYAARYGGKEKIPAGIIAKVAACPFLDLEKHGIEVSPDTVYYIYKKYVNGSISQAEMVAYFEGYCMLLGGDNEIQMARKIRDVFEGPREGTLLHIGGVLHNIRVHGHPSTLYPLLRDLEPERACLMDF